MNVMSMNTVSENLGLGLAGLQRMRQEAEAREDKSMLAQVLQAEASILLIERVLPDYLHDDAFEDILNKRRGRVEVLRKQAETMADDLPDETRHKVALL